MCGKVKVKWGFETSTLIILEFNTYEKFSWNWGRPNKTASLKSFKCWHSIADFEKGINKVIIVKHIS
jgi:hypothetical protein